MANKKIKPDNALELMPLDMMSALSEMDFDPSEMMENVMEMEAQLIEIAHSISQDAIHIHEFESEKERIAAAHRQVKLLGQLYAELREVTNPDLQ